jgi:hypothetical protein
MIGPARAANRSATYSPGKEATASGFGALLTHRHSLGRIVFIGQPDREMQRVRRSVVDGEASRAFDAVGRFGDQISAPGITTWPPARVAPVISVASVIHPPIVDLHHHIGRAFAANSRLKWL